MRTVLTIGLLLSVLFAGAFGIATILRHDASERADQRAYLNQLEGCERGNVLRQIVFSNTSTAARENRGTRIGRDYRENVRLMLQTKGVDPRTGAVTCTEVIQAP